MKITNFAPYSIAVKLKSLGFNEPCIAGWNGNTQLVDSNLFKINSDAPDKHPSAPLYTEVIDWLFKVSDGSIIVIYDPSYSEEHRAKHIEDAVDTAIKHKALGCLNLNQ